MSKRSINHTKNYDRPVVGEAYKVHLAKFLAIVMDGFAVSASQVNAEFVHGLNFTAVLAGTLAHLIKVVREHLVPRVNVELFLSRTPPPFRRLCLIIVTLAVKCSSCGMVFRQVVV
jgi:hypothetical protein